MFQNFLDLISQGGRLNFDAGEVELRPPGAPTTERTTALNGGFKSLAGF